MVYSPNLYNSLTVTATPCPSAWFPHRHLRGQRETRSQIYGIFRTSRIRFRSIELRLLMISDWWDAMRRVGFAAAMMAISVVNVASAACYGTDTFQNCDDSSVNGYTINRFGVTTIMTRGNAQTGSSWSR